MLKRLAEPFKLKYKKGIFMNLTGLSSNIILNFPVKKIHQTYHQLSRWESSYDDGSGWMIRLEFTNDFANCIILNVENCKNEEGKLIDRKDIRDELQTLAKDINKIIDYVSDLLKRKPHLDLGHNRFNKLISIKSESAKLQIKADEMIFKSVKHDDANGILLLLAAKSDVNSLLNNIPKDLINLFATTLFEVKLDKSIKDSKDI